MTTEDLLSTTCHIAGRVPGVTGAQVDGRSPRSLRFGKENAPNDLRRADLKAERGANPLFIANPYLAKHNRTFDPLNTPFSGTRKMSRETHDGQHDGSGDHGRTMADKEKRRRPCFR